MSENNNVNLHFYSERGIVNSIILWLKSENKIKICNFLNQIKDCEGEPVLSIENYLSIDIYDEFSFGDFGSPDLIIKVNINDEDSRVFIIEAKISTYLESAISGDEDGNIVYSNNASKINVQLSLRKRFIEFIKENDYSNGIEDSPSNDYDYPRKLKKEELLTWIAELKKNVVKYYYVALTDDKQDVNPLKNDSRIPLYAPENDYCYLLYCDIEGVMGDNPTYKATWEHTNINRGKTGDIIILRDIWDDNEKKGILPSKIRKDFIALYNKTAITIKQKRGNSIFRLWKTNKEKEFAMEIINLELYLANFEVSFEKMCGDYYLVTQEEISNILQEVN